MYTCQINSHILSHFLFRKSVSPYPLLPTMKTINQEGFAFDSYDKAEGGSFWFQGGMTAPPKGFGRNFTAASLLHLQYPRPPPSLRPPPPPLLSYQTVEQSGRGGGGREGESEGEGEGRRQRGCSCHQHHPLLSTSLLSSAGVLMIHFPPDMRKLLAQRKKAVNQCY